MRKRHSQEAGYVAERMNPYFPGYKVVIYIAQDQGIDASGEKYAVVCDAHAMQGGAPSVPKARRMMKSPEEFCLDCRAFTETNQ